MTDHIPPPAIEFRSVCLSFNGRQVLDHVSFRLESGQMIILTGNSASGKTVLLHLAIGLLTPDEGTILIDGRDVAEMTEPELLATRSERMGLVFQEDTLFTGMSVYDNAAYRLVEHHWREDAVDRAVVEILTFVGLAQDVAKLPEELSIGMRRRLEIARALAGWPPIMLFDEPTSGLDPINARQVLDLIIRARDVQQISSLLVTKELHQIPYVVNHCVSTTESGEMEVIKGVSPHGATTRIMVLEEGRIAFCGSLNEFDESELPAVTALTHPESELPLSTEFIKDPWSKTPRR